MSDNDRGRAPLFNRLADKWGGQVLSAVVAASIVGVTYWADQKVTQVEMRRDIADLQKRLDKVEASDERQTSTGITVAIDIATIRTTLTEIRRTLDSLDSRLPTR